jgi:DNA polymerase-1
MCYELATIKTDAKLPFQLSDFVYQGYDAQEVMDFARKYELKQFPSRLPASQKKGEQTKREISSEIVSSFKGIELGENIGVALDIDFDEYHGAELNGLSISTKEKAYYISEENLIKDGALKKILENESIKKNVYDGKLVEVGLARLGLEIKGISFDVSICGYLLDSSITGGYRGVYAYFGMDVNEKDEAPSLFEVGHPKTNGKIASFALAIEDKAISLLRQNDALKLYEEVEFPLSHVLAKMEIEGFPLDGKVLSEFGDEFKAKVKSLEKEIYEMAGHPFNISSPKQVGEVLYGELSIGDGKEKSTSVDTLKYLSPRHPIIA